VLSSNYGGKMNFAVRHIPTLRGSIFRRLVPFLTSRTGVLGATTVGSLVVRTGSSMLLTRLLTPYDFGIIGIITAVFFTVTLITDLGFEAFLVRHERTDERHFRDVIWTIHAKRGFALFAAVALASPVIAWAFGKPVVALPLAVTSVIFIVNGLASLSPITALRRDKSRELSLLDLGLQIFQTIVCLSLALWWRNAWSMIAAMILQSVLRAICSYVFFQDSAQRPARDRLIAREFLAFSRIVLMSSALTLLIGQSDKMVLGRLFTLDQFGLYAIALTISSAPTSFASAYIRRIAYPIYAKSWREAPDQLRNVYYNVRRAAARLYAFGCGGLIGGAPLLIALLYDPRYAHASIFVSLIMIASALRLPNVAAAELLTATGDIKGTLRINMVRLVWLMFAMPTGIFLFGATGVVAAVGLIEVPAMLYCWVSLHRVRLLKLREEIAFLALLLAGAGIGFLVAKEVLLIAPAI